MSYQKISLNGAWKIAAGREKPKNFPHSVVVPALVDVAEPKFPWQKYDYFWYRTVFRLPDQAQFEKIYLQLEQVQYGTEVWLNNLRVGGDIPCYTSQEFDLTPFINRTGENELLVRVGAKHTLPEHAAVGQDFEKIAWIPGIWGDVWLHLYGAGRMEWTRIIPDLEESKVSLHSEIENFSEKEQLFALQYRIREKKSDRIVATCPSFNIQVPAQSATALDSETSLPDFTPWSPENPFLYALEVTLTNREQICHHRELPFGMRRFEIRGRHFYLNGKRRVLLGGNIPFHRLLNDPHRGILPWDMEWVKQAFIDVPREHNMFFFRFHLGRAYNRWYDLADKYGILLQDEWMFWTNTGTPEQIEKEFRAWLKEHGHHASVIIWDPLNESADPRITGEIVPRLKSDIDPTRPWEMVDFGEDHPYIYSLGPVLNGEKFGYSRSIFDLQNSPTPVMVNEYNWWWLDSKGDPTPLTQIVMERWLGRNPTKEQNSKIKIQMLAHQAFLVSELTELWRRLNIDGIMPFVYLSCDSGMTSNWFLGKLEELKPKPVLAALKNAFSPLGVSIELWDRHFLAGEQRGVNIYLFNDADSGQTVRIQVQFLPQEDIAAIEKTVLLTAGEHRILPLKLKFPDKPGSYTLRARIATNRGVEIARSEKPVFIFPAVKIKSEIQDPRSKIQDPKSEISLAKILSTEKFPSLVLLDSDLSGEIRRFLEKSGVPVHSLEDGLENAGLVLINGGAISRLDSALISQLTHCVEQGGVIIVQEPELGVETEMRFPLLNDLGIVIQPRQDSERGGYDSYVFPEDSGHFLWKEIAAEHLRMFNGSLGGEIVSKHNVRPTMPFNALARCHLSLRVPAVMEIPCGKGWVIISRIQVRGRLLPETSSPELYGRRYDPVAEQYFRNLLAGYIGQGEYHETVRKMLADWPVCIAHLRASSGEIHHRAADEMEIHWGGKIVKPQWIWIDLGKLSKPQKLTITGDVTFAKTFEIFVSGDDRQWDSFSRIKDFDKPIFVFDFQDVDARYLRIEFSELGGKGGYSVWKVKIE